MSDLSKAATDKLLVSGLVKLRQKNDLVEVRRGMTMKDRAGGAVGVVAALVLPGPCQEVTHILLGHLPPTAVYPLIPLHLIECLEGETLWLRASAAAIEKLPVHQPK